MRSMPNTPAVVVLVVICALASLTNVLGSEQGVAHAANSGQQLLIEEDGHIDSILDNHVVINDSSFTLTPSTLFFNSQGARSERSAFKTNIFVHYAANNNREITSIRRINQTASPPASTTPDEQPADQQQPPAKKRDKLIFENGVWHN